MKMNQTQVLRIGVTLGALVLVIVRVWKPHLQIDSNTTILLIVALLPWAQPLIKSIELLGVKLELQDMKSELADVKAAAENAQSKATFILSPTTSAPTPEPAQAQATDSADEVFEKLMKDYEHIRATQPSGTARTQAMTAIVRRMTDLAPSLQNFDVTRALMSTERGRRLAAYAYLYALPHFQFIEPLVASVTELEDKPFGEYWGLQAISRHFAESGGIPVPEKIRLQLLQYAERVPRGTDRDYEIRKIIGDLRPQRGD